MTLIAFQVPYVNWVSVMPPVDARPLVIRHDAKGDGHFASPRSGRRQHRGVDLAAALHSPVRAIRSGTVVQVGMHRGMGRFVEIDHGHELHSLYAHLNDVRVDAGEKIKQGDLVGTVGKTGNARHPWITPHLHLEVVRDGVPIDPLTLGLRVVEPPASPSDRRALANETSGSSDAAEDE
ncbi:MAG: M23 family metallopeptidase [Candidatus Omnitrophica bacterium]|nr:M23 family metallopeptidase [Candidatus Omnitrophota bacterium]